LANLKIGMAQVNGRPNKCNLEIASKLTLMAFYYESCHTNTTIGPVLIPKNQKKTPDILARVVRVLNVYFLKMEKSKTKSGRCCQLNPAFEKCGGLRLDY